MPCAALSVADAAVAIVVRPAEARDAEQIARVRVDSWRTTYRGIVPEAYLAGMDVERSTQLWQRVLTAGQNTASVFVAERDGEIVAFAAGNMLTEPRHDLNAELTAIYVQREFQRVGIGGRLVGQVARAQRSLGAHGMIVWVIAANKPARAFYESLGGTLLVEQPFEWDGIPLVEVGYGFADLDALIAACERPPEGLLH